VTHREQPPQIRAYPRHGSRAKPFQI
jgi:hypothetical protein